MILKSRGVRHGSTGIYIHHNVHLRYIVYCIKKYSSKKKVWVALERKRLTNKGRRNDTSRKPPSLQPPT